MNRAEPRRYKGKERRAAHRFNLIKHLEYRIVDGQSASEWKSGSIRNMSARGVLIETADVLPIDSIVEAEMDWTGLYHAKPRMRLLLVGRSVRVEDRSVAMRIFTHEFRDVQPALIGRRRPHSNRAVA
jgi:hypothetical protein